MFEVLPDVSYTQRTVLKRRTTMSNNSTNACFPVNQSRNFSQENHEDVEQIISVVLSFIFLFIGVLGNSAVIIYNIFLNNDKTPSSWLVTHLASADLLVCLIIYPANIVGILDIVEDKLMRCKIEFTTTYVSLFLSIMILLSITIDKYLYVSKPLRYPLIVRTRRTKIFLSCIWLTALVQFPLLYHYMDTNECEEVREWEEEEREEERQCNYPLPAVGLHAILQSAAICIMTILNYKMFKIVKQQRQRIALEFVLQPRQSEQAESGKNMTWLRHLAKEMKAMKTFAIIVGVMTFCFIPYIVINVLLSSAYDFNDFYPIFLHLVGINSIANAFIYALRHKKYIKAYKKLFSSARARLFSQNNCLTDGETI